MTKRRGLVLVSVWAVTATAVTLWILARGDEVTAGNAMLVGVVAGTAVTAMVGKSKQS